MDRRGPDRVGAVRGGWREERHANDQQHRKYLDERQKHLHRAAEFYADVIDRRHDDEPDDGERLRPRESKIVRLDPVSDAGQVKRKDWRGDSGNKIREKLHAARGDRRGGRGASDDRVHPSEKKTPRWSEAAAEIRVLAARFRNGRAQFRIRERAKNGKQRAGDPRRKHNGNAVPFARHLRRFQKNSGADHRAHHDRGGSPRAEPAHEFKPVFLWRRAHALFSRDRARRILLIRLPTNNVTAEPMRTYHVNATGVNRQIETITARPVNMPIVAPVAVAFLSNVPRKKSPRRLPKGIDATLRPVSRKGPHVFIPKASSTAPHASVTRRESRRNSLGFVWRPLRREKSRTVLAVSELSEPLALDMATARIEASRIPARPVGISRTRKIGRMASGFCPAASSGVCCEKTKSKTPTRRKRVN